ncbi:MAG: hypothetical protein U1A78_33160 [Polyangia bacterium]
MSSLEGAQQDLSVFAKKSLAVRNQADDHEEAERFIADRMQGLRERMGARCESFLVRRDVVPGRRGPERVLVEGLRICPQRERADSEWWLIVWNVDRLEVEFRRYATRAALREAARADYQLSRPQPGPEHSA